MYVKSAQSWYGRTEQRASGAFLMIVADEERDANGFRKLRACVRHVRMAQCGHWMMGSAQVGADSVTVSGTYGSDGLPMDREKFPHAWATLLPVPDQVAEAFWKGGGHNSAGIEGSWLHAWALANLYALRRAGTVRP